MHHSPSIFVQKRKGVVALAVLLIVAFSIVAISLGVGFLSMNQSQIVLDESESVRLFGYADGCMEEAYSKVRRLSAYSGETLIVDGVTCTIVVTSDEDDRTITVRAAYGNYTKTLRSDVSLLPTFSVASWEET